MEKYQIGTLLYLENDTKETVGIIIDKQGNDYFVKWSANFVANRIYKYTKEELDDNYPLV